MTDAPTSPDADTPTVLIIEDEQDLADLYAAWLQNLYTVRTAYNGEEALTHLDESIDVALIDRRMPGLSGDEVLGHVREEEINIRITIVSAVTPDFDVIGMGFDDYLVKPIDADELRMTVERLLQFSKYDEQIQELEQLVATKTALESEHSHSELQEHHKYQQLRDRIETVRVKVDDTVANLDDEPVERLFHNLTTNSPESTRQGGETR
jgi:two-component system response regulator AdeR